MNGETAPTATRMVVFSLMSMEQLAQALSVSLELANAIAEEEGWRRHRGRDGRPRVAVPETVLAERCAAVEAIQAQPEETPSPAPVERWLEAISTQVSALTALRDKARAKLVNHAAPASAERHAEHRLRGALSG